MRGGKSFASERFHYKKATMRGIGRLRAAERFTCSRANAIAENSPCRILCVAPSFAYKRIWSWCWPFCLVVKPLG
jgi:hypothetical protein